MLYDIAENAYPENYDNLTEEVKDGILDYFRSTKDAAAAANDYAARAESMETARFYSNMAYEYGKTLLDAARVLRIVGIFVESNWVNHGNDYFLATRKDAEEQNIYLRQ